MEKSKEQLINEFYAKQYYLSYSALNKMLYSPGLFYRHYILRQEEDKTESYLLEGKVTHCLLLENDSFNEKFILLPSSIPTATTKKVVDDVFKLFETVKQDLNDYDSLILDILKDINTHQALKDDKKTDANGFKRTGDEKRIAKIVTSESIAYWDFLKIRGDKELIDEEILMACREAVDAVHAEKDICKLMGFHEFNTDDVEIFNEMFLQTETDKTFGLKGFVDNIKVDHSSKTIYINDLKKTSKALADFNDSVEFYNYWAQAAIYSRLVQAHFYELIQKGYEVEFRFVVIDKYLQIYPFEVADHTMTKWQMRLEEKLHEVNWHYSNKEYKLPYKFAKSLVKL